MSLIFDGLIVGSFEESFDKTHLERLKVTHILNVASELDVVERVDRVYFKCDVRDDDETEYIPRIFQKTNTFISDAINNHGCVFVHCLEGKSRSVCVCIAYLVCLLGYDFDYALETIQACRSIDIFPVYHLQTQEFCLSNGVNRSLTMDVL